MLEFYLVGVAIAFFGGFFQVWKEADNEHDFIFLSFLALLSCTLSWLTITFFVYAQLWRRCRD